METYKCKSEIVCVKFSHSGKILIASAKNCHVLVFMRKNGLYFKTKEDVFQIPNEIILTITFTDDSISLKGAAAILGTSAKNHYIVGLGLRDHYQMLQDNTCLEASKFELKYPVEGLEEYMPILAISSPFMVFCGEKFGAISIFDSYEQFEGKIAGFSFGHSGQMTNFFWTKIWGGCTRFVSKRGNSWSGSLGVY